MKKSERDAIGQAGRRHVENHYSFEKYQSGWIDILDNVYEKHGSWENRKKYSPWTIEKVN